MEDRGPLLRVSARDVLAVMLMVGVALIVLHLAANRLAYGGGPKINPRYEGYLFLDADHEASLPTWWQQTVLAVCAGLALILGAERSATGKPERRHWIGLGLILLFLSVDEGTQIHERLTTPVRDALGVDGGLLYYAWVLPAALLLGLFGLAFFRFWQRLPARARWVLAAAGGADVGGGLVGGALGGAYEAEHGKDFGYTAITAVEEGFEMLGQALLTYALLTLLAVRERVVAVSFSLHGDVEVDRSEVVCG